MPDKLADLMTALRSNATGDMWRWTLTDALEEIAARLPAPEPAASVRGSTAPQSPPRCPACGKPMVKVHDHDGQPIDWDCDCENPAPAAPEPPEGVNYVQVVPGTTVHFLKTWPEFWWAVKTGRKRFEIRKDDRGFAKGDLLLLKEWEPDAGAYTGREIQVRVTDLWRDVPGGLADGYVVMSIAPEEPAPASVPWSQWEWAVAEIARLTEEKALIRRGAQDMEEQYHRSTSRNDADWLGLYAVIELDEDELDPDAHLPDIAVDWVRKLLDGARTDVKRLGEQNTALREKVAGLERERDKARKDVKRLRAGPKGPYTFCKTCGRSMTRDRVGGTWMCPRCTLARAERAEQALAEAEKQLKNTPGAYDLHARRAIAQALGLDRDAEIASIKMRAEEILGLANEAADRATERDRARQERDAAQAAAARYEAARKRIEAARDLIEKAHDDADEPWSTALWRGVLDGLAALPPAPDAQKGVGES